MDDTSPGPNLLASAWSVLIVVAATLAAYLLPLSLVTGFIRTGWVTATESALTILFGADLAVQILRARRHPSTPKQRNAPGLYLDVAAAIPFFLIPGSSVFRLFRLAKLYRVAQAMRRLRHFYVAKGTLLRLTFFLYWLALSIHWITCGWIELTGSGSAGSLRTAYVDALYWTTVTITTVGYGDIVPVSIGQKLFAIGVMMFGAGIYAYLIGNIASLISNLDPVRAGYARQRERLDAFMHYRKLPIPLRRRIQRYFDYLWEQRMVADESEVLDSLSPSLREEIALFLKRDLIKSVPLFDAADEAFERDIALNLEPLVALPGDFVVRVGEVGRAMYFLSRGKVEIVGKDGDVMNTLGEGDFFGEIALFLDQPRSAGVRALTACDLYALDKPMFERIVSTYPNVAQQLEIEAKRRYGVDVDL